MGEQREMIWPCESKLCNHALTRRRDLAIEAVRDGACLDLLVRLVPQKKMLECIGDLVFGAPWSKIMAQLPKTAAPPFSIPPKRDGPFPFPSARSFFHDPGDKVGMRGWTNRARPPIVLSISVMSRSHVQSPRSPALDEMVDRVDQWYRRHFTNRSGSREQALELSCVGEGILLGGPSHECLYSET